VPTVSEVVFGLSAAQQNAINAGGTLRLELTGQSGWDLTLDAFGFDFQSTRTPGTPVSTPGTLALLGAALMGAGLASRRRRA
jgi:hypothetical protein